MISGIGFLGAGVIIQARGSVHGLTTAATIWAVAAVGVTVAIEAYLVAVFAALLGVVLLELRVVTKNIRPSVHDNDEDDRPPAMPRDE